jgi:Carboxypeptidase regulatory-like domain
MTFRRSLSFGTLLPLLLAMSSLHAQTQTMGNVNGLVSDPTGAVVPGAAFTITYAATTEAWSTVSDETGRYRFPLLKPGDYSITA